jgi:serpin B
MTLAGARGATADEMQQTLHLPQPDAALYAGMQAWQGGLLPAGDDPLYELSIANRLWGQIGLDFKDAFLEICRRYYGAELGRADFVGAPEAARAEINAWVEEKTREKIRDLVPAGAIKPTTALVLTNAVYFLGSWQNTFAAQATHDEPFYLAEGGEVAASLMLQEERFLYTEIEGAQIIELPYRGAPLAMVVVLPREVDGLAALEKQLTAEAIAGWLGNLKSHKVRLYLPRFETTAEFNLNDVLSRLGMPTAFGRGADFTGIAADERLFISDVLHKAFVAVDEKGTEAAAASAVIVGRTSLPPPEEPEIFRADHPFLFFIRDVPTGTILFAGRLEDPSI